MVGVQNRSGTPGNIGAHSALAVLTAAVRLLSIAAAMGLLTICHQKGRVGGDSGVCSCVLSPHGLERAKAEGSDQCQTERKEAHLFAGRARRFHLAVFLSHFAVQPVPPGNQVGIAYLKQRLQKLLGATLGRIRTQDSVEHLLCFMIVAVFDIGE